MTPRIMHVDIDAFFASVEQRRDPRLRGRPVIVGSGVIASCSYEARRFGLRAGMELNQAKRLCPRVVVLKGHYPTYRSFAEKVFDACRETTPDIETYLDEAYCDLTGFDRLYGPPRETARRLKARIREATGLAVSVGVGPNRMVAKMAGGARRPDGLTVVEEDAVDGFVRGLPVEKLPGVGRATHGVLRKLNIGTVGELRALTRESLAELFGANGAALYERCRGRDTRAIHQREVPRTISRETTFHRETADPDEILAMLHYLCERAANAMRGLGLQCRRVALRIRYNDFKGETAAFTMPHPGDLDRDIFGAASGLLGRIHTRRVSLRHAGVVLSRFSRAGCRQMEMFDEAEARRLENLYRCLDTLRKKFGHSAIVAGKSLELLGKMEQDSYGYVLRTPCLTK